MKRASVIIFLFLILVSPLFSNGVAIVDVSKGIYLKLVESYVNINVENQVAIVTSTQVFTNQYDQSFKVKYGFPMPEQGSATGLNFFADGNWYRAKFLPTPQDTTLPGSDEEIDANLKEYLGQTPLYYNIEHDIEPGETLIVELTYVELLPYKSGRVNFVYNGDYRLLQTAPLNKIQFNFHLNSSRTIQFADFIGLSPDSSFNDGHQADLYFERQNEIAKYNFNVRYALSLEELGLFSMSTFLIDSQVPDRQSRGFFTFIAEPDPSENTEVISKVFTLIVDRSGSMSGSKIEQAREAAKFIVNNLNEGDYFNIVDFASTVTSFRSEHVPFNQQNQQSAINYISTFVADGGTNISGAFDVAIPQFSAASDSTANIIIFFTDGQPTVGITEINALLNHINQTIIQNEVNVSIFAFGIGNDANKQLLTQLAEQNNGLAKFLGNDELETEITQFYLTIRSPVLINTHLTFSPDNLIVETYPQKLPNLYKGQQLIVSGRYLEPSMVNVKLSGQAFGKEVEYSYEMALADSAVEKFQFLTKIWAKQKIEQLLVQYYSLDENDPQAEVVKEEIIGLSVNFGVLSPFTSLSGEDYNTPIEELNPRENVLPQAFELLGNFPNPFNPKTTIQFKVNINLHQLVFVKIYNAAGQLVKIFTVQVNGPGLYQLVWDGTLKNKQAAPSGSYFYIIDFGEHLLAGRMMLIK